MTFKDLFSKHAEDYKRFRPTYPEALFAYFASQVESHTAAWDCGTGNGQGAVGLAKHFTQVYATDASASQIEQAEHLANITYKVASAEQSGLPDNIVSLITVFQALHWFNIDVFFKEAQRILIPNGLLALIGYNTALTEIEEIDKTYHEFCFEYLWKKKCWDMERDILNCNYQKMAFPFNEITPPKFHIEMHWNYQDYLSYLNTWSSVKKHIKLYNDNPVKSYIIPRIENHWPDKNKPRLIRFPLILRLGRK